MNREIILNKLYQEKGSSTVEFAIVLPMLMLFLFGIVEFGRVLSVSHTLNAAAREGARVASLPGTDNSIVLAAIENELAQAGLTVNNVEFDPPDISTANRNDPVTVRVFIGYDSIGWVQGFFPGLSGTMLQSAVVMRKEGFS